MNEASRSVPAEQLSVNQENDRKWSDAWEMAYRWRVKTWEQNMPPREQAKLGKAWTRMMQAERRYLPHCYRESAR